ncbi:MAG: hypothetical protein H0T51_02890 [Pirellulales bacterium]|nr:hypothetical protein [Pirellulales bacterium]
MAAWALGIGLSLLTALGCGEAEVAAISVKGTITYNGKPANNGVIAFLQTGGRPIGAAIQPDGAYEAQIPPGNYQVRIDAPPAPPAGASEREPLPMGPRSVPEQYANFATSGLTLTVGDESGQQHDFKLP